MLVVNCQKLHCPHCHTMTLDRVETETTRCECFAMSEASMSDCPFEQRWGYGFEASYTIRLPRRPLGETIGRN